MGLDYVDLICRDLERKGEIVFSDGFYSFITPNKKSLNRAKPPNGEQEKFVPKTHAESALLGIPQMTKGLIQVLENAGYKTIESLADAPIARFIQETKFELHKAAGLINQARKALNKIGE